MLALVAVGLIALASLVVGVIALIGSRSSATQGRTAPTTATAPSFTAEQVAAAKKNLCDIYQAASRSVEVDTNGREVALARISLTNGAGMLEVAADNAALGGREREAARTLASAYRTVVAVGSVFDKETPVGRTSLDDANRADAAMAAMCP